MKKQQKNSAFSEVKKRVKSRLTQFLRRLKQLGDETARLRKTPREKTAFNEV